MPKRYLMVLTAIVASISLSVSVLNGHPVSADAAPAVAAHPANGRATNMHTINMASVPAVAAGPEGAVRKPVPSIPVRRGQTAAEYAQQKAAAAMNPHAPSAVPNAGSPAANSVASGADTASLVNTPGAISSFQGMSNSASICPFFGGCQPPDMALAANPSWVLQGVNTSFAIYNTAGVRQPGWPKSAQSFFGVPSPGSCSPVNQPFLSDPRAAFDPVDVRFWAAILEVEGGFGVNTNCPFLSRYWIAVSQTSDPRGAWNVYAFDMALGTTNGADYTQFGIDNQAIYFSGNMFNQAGTSFQYAEMFGALKKPMESGQGVGYWGFTHLTVGGVAVDTVQPMAVEARFGPRGGLFINSFNLNGDPFGHNCSSTACHGLEVWTLTNPGLNTTGLSGVFVDSITYILPPSSTQPGCAQCIESLDTRISGTPAFSNGLISFALESGINNGSQTVPGILWGQIHPTQSDAGAVTAGSIYQQGYYVYSGNGSASFPAVMPDGDGNLFMVFDFMNSTIDPGVAYAGRRSTFTLGSFHDGGIFLRSSSTPTNNSRWGDYSAAAYSGFVNNAVWIAGEFSGSNADWSTQIGQLKYNLNAP